MDELRTGVAIHGAAVRNYVRFEFIEFLSCWAADTTTFFALDTWQSKLHRAPISAEAAKQVNTADAMLAPEPETKQPWCAQAFGRAGLLVIKAAHATKRRSSRSAFISMLYRRASCCLRLQFPQELIDLIACLFERFDKLCRITSGHICV